MDLHKYAVELSYAELSYSMIFGMAVVLVVIGLVFLLKKPQTSQE